jgi:hypothetical protein
LSASASEGVKRQSDKPDLPEGHPLWELWETFVEFYGSAFTKQYGHEPTWTWLDALQDLSVADYGEGIARLKKRDSPFPPNPGEFYSLCKQESAAQYRQRVGTMNTALPPPVLPPERAAEEIKKIRAMLGAA